MSIQEAEKLMDSAFEEFDQEMAEIQSRIETIKRLYHITLENDV